MEINRNYVLQIVASLCLCDHMGDVGDDIDRILKDIEFDVEWDDFSDLLHELGKHGITTIYGTEVGKYN